LYKRAKKLTKIHNKLTQTLGMVLNNTAAQVGCVISGNNGFEAKPNQKI
jgi:hypothetical protein